MSDNKKSSDQQPFRERRARDSGITSGGRRKSDRQLIGGAGKKSRILIGLSFLVSMCILFWAFSLPFRGENAIVTFGDSESKNTDLEANLVSHAPDWISNDDYLQEMMHLEDDLKRQLERKNRAPKKLPGKTHARNHWKRGLEQRMEDVKLLAELADGEIEKGTIEWQAQQDLKEYLQDVPQ